MMVPKVALGKSHEQTTLVHSRVQAHYFSFNFKLSPYLCSHILAPLIGDIATLQQFVYMCGHLSLVRI